MRITDEQHTILASLKCERLSARPDNRKFIERFFNSRNEGLALSLKREAWDEDVNGHTAYYLVKSSEDEVLFFFSLKCGALFNHLNEEELKQNKRIGEILEEILVYADADSEEAQMAANIIEKLRSKKGLSIEDIGELITRVPEKCTALETLKEEKEREKNQHIVQVNNTYSGIELVHFCKNEATQHVWNSYNMPHPLGKVVFWKFIVPIMECIREYVGCQYAFLFAADLSPDELLISYYTATLHFEQPEHIGTSKPYYDYLCRFMCQEINRLSKWRSDFFDNFNPDDEVV